MDTCLSKKAYYSHRSSKHMKRKSKVAAAAAAATLAFVFLVPITQVDFEPAGASPCPHYTTEFGSMSACSIGLTGHASITYWLFGIGATYGSGYNTGYGFGFAKCLTFNLANTSFRECSSYSV